MAHEGTTLCRRNLWVDVGDLLTCPYRHVTGIQRTAVSILCQLRSAEFPFRLRYCRYLSKKGFVEVDDEAISACVSGLTGSGWSSGAMHLAETTAHHSRSLGSLVEGILRSIYKRLPWQIAAPSLGLYDAFADWISACWAYALFQDRPVVRRTVWKRAAHIFSRGDILLALNVPLSRQSSGYASCVEVTKESSGLQCVALIYDLIAWKLPGLFSSNMYSKFVPWLKKTIDVADLLLTISDNTKKDLAVFMRCEGRVLKDIEVIRLGDTLSASSGRDGSIKAALQFLAGTGYVLFVSTIENRKGHRLLFYVWKMLLDRYGESVPPMVWAGVWGWSVNDLKFEIADKGDLKGRLIILESPSEEELDFLYSHCLFTLYPSIYEGWGLPVAESLAHGKYCVASNASAIPEIAGDLIDYHSPGDFDACYRLVEQALFDVQYRKDKEAEIRAKYRVHTWADCAKILVEKIQAHFPAGSEGRDRVPSAASANEG